LDNYFIRQRSYPFDREPLQYSVNMLHHSRIRARWCNGIMAKKRGIFLLTFNSVNYRYITGTGFPISKSRKPKSPEFNEFILKMSYPLPGIRGKNEMDI
jgi:hypothetical protein